VGEDGDCLRDGLPDGGDKLDSLGVLEHPELAG
jgi:hypothetical protein